MRVNPLSPADFINFLARIIKTPMGQSIIFNHQTGGAGPGVALIAPPRSTATLGPATQLLIADHRQ